MIDKALSKLMERVLIVVTSSECIRTPLQCGNDIQWKRNCVFRMYVVFVLQKIKLCATLCSSDTLTIMYFINW